MIARIFVVCLLGAFLSACGSQSESGEPGSVVIPQGMMALPDLPPPSEDVSYILDTSKLIFPRITWEEWERGYVKPRNRSGEWLIFLTFPPDVDTAALRREFNRSWSIERNFNSMMAHDREAGKWDSGDAISPDRIDSLYLGVGLWKFYFGSNRKQMEDSLMTLFQEVKAKAESVSLKMGIRADMNMDAIWKEVEFRRECQEKFDRDFTIVLKAEGKFDNEETEDVLRSLGFEWGDGDLYHWNNPYAYGAQSYIMVWTTTEPGYFYPGNTGWDQEDLVFGMEFPYSADPVHMYEIMHEAANYAKKRLGGTLLNQEGKPLNFDKEWAEIKRLTGEMTELGMPPGSANVVFTF